MKTLSDLLAEVDADITKAMPSLLADMDTNEELDEIARNNVPNSNREVIEVFHSEHELGEATDQSEGAGDVFDWLRSNIQHHLEEYAAEEFERQKVDYETTVDDFEAEGCVCRQDGNLRYTVYPPNPEGVDQVSEVAPQDTEYEAWKAFEKEQE